MRPARFAEVVEAAPVEAAAAELVVEIEPAADAAVRRRLADQEGHLRISDVVAREIFAHVVDRNHIHMVRHLVDVGFFAEIGMIPLDAAAA